MSKKTFLLVISFLLMISCTEKSLLSKDFNCNSNFGNQLEVVKDVKNQFLVQLPKYWKTNLYYDDLQSSIYTADTTKNLTETILIDVSHIQKEINFNQLFKLQQEQESLAKQLILTDDKKGQFLTKESYYTISKGKKSTYPYLLFNLFVKQNESNFLLIKTEIYGDSLVDKRICNAISLIEKIKFTND